MNKIELVHPVTNGDATVTSLTFRRAKVKDIERIQAAVETGGEIGGSIASIACLSGLPEDVVREIDADDFVRIAEAMTDFLPQRKIGISGEPTSQT